MTMITAPGGQDVVAVRRHAVVTAVLEDARFEVPAVAGSRDGMGWLRGNVARFSNGDAHTRRRGLVTDRLAGIAPANLRAAARQETRARLAAAPGRLDVAGELARRVPLRVLGAALGVPDAELDGLTAATARVAAAYHPGVDAGTVRRGDEALAALVELFAADEDETTANLIGILVQACDATAGLIGNTAAAVLGSHAYRDAPVEALVHETLRLDPPVRATRRQASGGAVVEGVPFGAGTVLALDFAAANRDPEVFERADLFDPSRGFTARLTFGHGLRPCPGHDHALALACGVLEPLVADWCREPGEITYEPSANLRIPARLDVVPR